MSLLFLHVFCSSTFTYMNTSCNLHVTCNAVIDLPTSLFYADTQWVSVEGNLGPSRIWAGSGLLFLWQDGSCLGRDCRRVQWQAERTEPLGSYNSGNVAISTQCSTRQSVENPYDDLSFNVCVSVGHFGWNTFETIASVLFSDQENHAGGQSHFSDRCEVCPQTHGSDAGHLLCRRRGEDLRGSGRDEP